MVTNILLFLLFSFLGWILDTTYCSIGHKKFTPSGYYKGIPICPMYGFGGLLLLTSFIQLRALDPIYTILITTFIIIFLEYIGGWFCEHVLKEKLWDYSEIKGNIHGYINPIHSVYWLILTIVMYFLINPHLGSITFVIDSLQNWFAPYDTYLTLIFLIFAYSLTTRTRDRRLEKYKIEPEKIKKKIEDIKKKII